ncbi:hypothetical protein B0H14DRAFT_3553987 [Mycena olivaceomarginata]|nr:hypothetical protein B0H14DRAFT_3553987 [Mycena olivaceomarginata]
MASFGSLLLPPSIFSRLMPGLPTPSRRLVIAPGSAVDVHGMPLPHQFPPIYKNLPSSRRVIRMGYYPSAVEFRQPKGWSWSGPIKINALSLGLSKVVDGFHPQTLQSIAEPTTFGTLAHFVESVVFMVRSGTLSGEYVAACARNICKYWVLLERMYQKRSQPVRQYPLRVDPNMAPPAELPRDGPEEGPSSVISTPSIDGSSPLRPLRRVWSDTSEDSTPLPRRRRLSQSRRTAVAGSSNPRATPRSFQPIFHALTAGCQQQIRA